MLFLFINAENLTGLQSEKIEELTGYLSVSAHPNHYRRPTKVSSVNIQLVCVLYTHIDQYNVFHCIDICTFSPNTGFEHMTVNLKQYYSKKYAIKLN
jgi:hypothetical protein